MFTYMSLFMIFYNFDIYHILCNN